MKNRNWLVRIVFLIAISFLFSCIAVAQKKDGNNQSLSEPEALPFSRRFLHRFELESRLGYVFPTNPFLRGIPGETHPIKNSYAGHLKYSFQYHSGSLINRIYGGAYQGIGIGKYAFGNKEQLGNPLTIYLFQGARICRISSRLSFNYEWNFGLSLGWKPYDRENNRYNITMGSRMNAIINTNFYLNWLLSSYCDLTSGITLTHFSNGNTKFPNAGINMMGVKVGLVYYINRKEKWLLHPSAKLNIPEFPRHFSYDLVLFGSWRRKGYVAQEEFVPSPLAYKVLGGSLSAMYNVSYKFRAGVALDAVYDASANVFVRTNPDEPQGFLKPPFNAQTALGVSGRLEYVMPYFTIGMGMGTNVLHRGGDLQGFYQMFLLKIAVTRNSFFHIGYNLQEFKTPNYLMLGIGFRFNNKYPVFSRYSCR